MKRMTMRVKSLLGAALVPLSVSLAALGCGGLGGELTDTICECEHCDDWKEEELRASFDASLEVAEAYECGAEWEEYAQCQIDEGECDEDEADWSVEDTGSCGGSVDSGIPCASDPSVCAGIGTCNGMTCITKSCSGTAGFTCENDSDCPGENKCADEAKDLFECEEDSSDDPGILNFDFD